jgi:hypothetical protein
MQVTKLDKRQFGEALRTCSGGRAAIMKLMEGDFDPENSERTHEGIIWDVLMETR